MLSFGACPNGYRRDCINKVCLARHIDDPQQQSYSSTFINNHVLQNAAKQQNQKKKYDTRSFTRKKSTSPRKSKVSNYQSLRGGKDGDREEEWDDGTNIPKNTTSKLNSCLGKSSDYVATGLDNLRNTCYMNSVLQCLAGTE